MTNIKLILQARLSSSRLPGKMLLPVGGLPLAVLCAKRASRSGLSLIVATSTEEGDDLLCDILQEHNINYARGPLNDVLGRFVLAAEGVADNDLVVRLTGDNPVVDADFIKDIVAHHQSAGGRYTRSFSPVDRLPYGLSAEVIEAGLLRELNKKEISAEDREHVTSFLTKQGSFELFKSADKRDLSHLRVTVDSFDDYLRASRLFSNITPDPVSVSWRALIDKVEDSEGIARHRTSYRMQGLKPVSRLALGTVQLGVNYGIANSTGRPGLEESRKILKAAIAYGINQIDTAAAYGESEKVIGASLTCNEKQDVNITTKLDVMAGIDESSSEQEIRNAVEASIYRSCHQLGLRKLDCVLLHRWQHYKLAGGKIWRALEALRAEGLISKLGASVQTPDEGLRALETDGVEFIQMPFNILDWRWRESGFIEQALKRKNIHIQARSVLLQGLLLLPSEQWPVIGRDRAVSVRNQLNQLVTDLGRQSVKDLCYAYVRAMAWVDSIVVGVEKEEQLLENLELFRLPELENVKELEGQIERVDQQLLNPAEWNIA